MVKGKNKKDDFLMNEAERAHAIIDRYIRNENDREELKQNLTPLIIQFLLRWDSDKELVMEDRIIEIVMKKMQEIYEADNECICKNVAETVGKQLAEVLEPWNRRLAGIEKALEGVAEWQKSVDELHKKMDKRVADLEERVYKTDHERIRALEDYASPKKTFWRMTLAGIIGIGLAILIFFMILNQKMAQVERMLEEHIKVENTK